MLNNLSLLTWFDNFAPLHKNAFLFHFISVNLHTTNIKNLPMTYTIFIFLEPYLAQWLQHESGGEYPIKLKRGSAEADILQATLLPQPKADGYIPQFKPEEGQVEIALPYFKGKDIRTYNYLPPKAAMALRECIRNRFRVKLWKDLYTVGNITKRTDITISEWMVSNGIVNDDRNWNTIVKIFQRQRAVYAPNKRLSTRCYTKHRKKTQNINTTLED